MEHEYKGFIYGHYDSRGGAFFVEAETREEADARFVAEFCVEPEYAKELCDEDFLGEATIRSWRKIENGEDILYGSDPSAIQGPEKRTEWVWCNLKDEFPGDHEGRHELELRNEPLPAEYEEDGAPSDNYGEDACGIACFMKQ